MNIRAIVRLIRKDCWLMRWPLAAYILAALAGLALTALGGSTARSAGITLAFNVLIGVSFHVLLVPVLGERERKTLAFVMSLPVTAADAAVAKPCDRNAVSTSGTPVPPKPARKMSNLIIAAPPRVWQAFPRRSAAESKRGAT